MATAAPTTAAPITAAPTTGVPTNGRTHLALGEIFSFAFDTFLSNKVRFTLTALGMVIGTASLILVTTIGLTGKQYLLNQIQSIGSNWIYAEYESGGGRITDTGNDALTIDDMEAVQHQVSGIVAASPVLPLNERVAVGGGMCAAICRWRCCASARCPNRSVGLGLEDFAGESKHFGFGGDGYGVRCAAVRRVALMVWEFAEAAGLFCGWYGGAIFGAEALHLDPQGALELKQLGTLFAGEEGGGYAVFSGAAGAAYAVDEIFGYFGQVKIDDVRDVLDVNTAGSDVGGDQNAVAALLKSSQGGVALGLRAVTVNHGGGKAVAIEILGDAVGGTLGAGEDQAAARFFGQQAIQSLLLAVRADLESLHTNVLGGL